MSRLVYVMGPPGVGKSTAVAGALDRLGWCKGEAELLAEKLLWGEPLFNRRGFVGVVLGKTKGTFSGTDQLSMEVNAEAIRWVTTDEYLPPLIVGEGSRLANPKFITAAAASSLLSSVTLVHMTADQDTLDARCAARGSNQKLSWRKTVATTARNTVAAGRAAGAQVAEIDTTHLSPADVVETLTYLM